VGIDTLASPLNNVFACTGYMGHTSGAAFYGRLSQVIPSLVPLAGIVAPPLLPDTYHTTDSRPLNILNQNPYELPTQNVARHFVAVFFHHCSDLFQWINVEQVERDLNEIYQHTNVGEVDVWKLCMLNAVLALGAQHAGGVPPSLGYVTDGEPPGLQFFARVKLLMLSVWEDGSIMSIRVLALMVRGRWLGVRRVKVVINRYSHPPGLLPAFSVTAR
jgi:hypothetical protein